MCRNIKTLFNFDPPATEDEIQAASLQFVRKLSGFTQPSKANEAAFQLAVQEVTAAAEKLLSTLVTNSPQRDRKIEIERARIRSVKRFGPRES
ncbi:DUF2277 domain-containing protein [Paenibacillus rhizovicinus]|uniref:DUF2277 domain-containing protein n=1 Tax=Paenibacillus rhizovicinus TaxID=2704463 RepID=A0A6C0P0X4_9BACL|nr:DUF2277 domain-containing protein [Paenibacillus rhizovicinus]QHW32031.1 DUF2277 domain-containing protein [Paenibacillus rhizovicinus]